MYAQFHVDWNIQKKGAWIHVYAHFKFFLCTTVFLCFSKDQVQIHASLKSSTWGPRCSCCPNFYHCPSFTTGLQNNGCFHFLPSHLKVAIYEGSGEGVLMDMEESIDSHVQTAQSCTRLDKHREELAVNRQRQCVMSHSIPNERTPPECNIPITIHLKMQKIIYNHILPRYCQSYAIQTP